jgi:Hemerythrin HHE cation binding domain
MRRTLDEREREERLRPEAPRIEILTRALTSLHAAWSILQQVPYPEVTMNRHVLRVPAALAALLVSAATAVRAAPLPGDTIPTPASAFSSEHELLLGGFGDVLRRAVARTARQPDRADLVRYLRSALLPHALIEERVLYPALDSVLGTRGYATATLVLDHRAIARMTIELAAVDTADAAAFERKALVLAAVIENHFASEEGFVLPALARRMREPDLRALLARMNAERVTP